jgi:hypothetical protein
MAVHALSPKSGSSSRRIALVLSVVGLFFAVSLFMQRIGLIAQDIQAAVPGSAPSSEVSGEAATNVSYPECDVCRSADETAGLLRGGDDANVGSPVVPRFKVQPGPRGRTAFSSASLSPPLSAEPVRVASIDRAGLNGDEDIVEPLERQLLALDACLDCGGGAPGGDMIDQPNDDGDTESHHGGKGEESSYGDDDDSGHDGDDDGHDVGDGDHDVGDGDHGDDEHDVADNDHSGDGHDGDDGDHHGGDEDHDDGDSGDGGGHGGGDDGDDSGSSGSGGSGHSG